MSSSSKTHSVAQSPPPPVKGTLTKTTTKAPDAPKAPEAPDAPKAPEAPKAPMKASTQAPTVTGGGMDGSNTANHNCHHAWIVCSHPTIPYTGTFCQKCGVEKR